jgi:hypothetical protein
MAQCQYEDVYLRAYETVGDLQHRLNRYFQFHNARRRYTALPAVSEKRLSLTPNGNVR